MLALLTQSGVHGFGNVVRRPFLLYGESVLLAQAITQLLKPAIDSAEAVHLPAGGGAPDDSSYDVTTDRRLSLHAFRPRRHHLRRRLVCGDGQPAIPTRGRIDGARGGRRHWWPAGGVHGATLRIKADQHFPSDVLVGGLIGTASGVTVPLLHSYVLPQALKAVRPGGHDWLVDGRRVCGRDGRGDRASPALAY